MIRLISMMLVFACVIACGNDALKNHFVPELFCGLWKIDVDKTIEMLNPKNHNPPFSDSERINLNRIANTTFIEISKTNLNIHISHKGQVRDKSKITFNSVSSVSEKDTMFECDLGDERNWQIHLALTSSNTLVFSKSSLPTPFCQFVWSKEAATRSKGR